MSVNVGFLPSPPPPPLSFSCSHSLWTCVTKSLPSSHLFLRCHLQIFPKVQLKGLKALTKAKLFYIRLIYSHNNAFCLDQIGIKFSSTVLYLKEHFSYLLVWHWKLLETQANFKILAFKLHSFMTQCSHIYTFCLRFIWHKPATSKTNFKVTLGLWPWVLQALTFYYLYTYAYAHNYHVQIINFYPKIKVAGLTQMFFSKTSLIFCC